MQKIIFLYGPSCSGKSTIADEIMKHENFFHVHYDRIKWLISDYHRDNKNQTDLIFATLMHMINEGIERDFDILIEGLGLELFEKVKTFYQARCEVLPIRVTADKKILEKRFLERVESAKNSKRKISNLSIDVFWQLYEKFNQDLGYGETIDTSDISIEETLNKMNVYLKA